MSLEKLDRPEVLSLLFYPRVQPGLPFSTARVRDIQVQVSGGIRLGGRLYPAEADSPAVLYFHGNGEIAADYDDIAPFYRELSLTLLVMDYRGYGRSEGSPSASSLLGDARDVYQAMDGLFQDNGLSPARLYVMGRSLGSAAAIEVAQHAGEQLSGLIIESGFAHTFDLLSRLGIHSQDANEARDGFGNLAKIGLVRVPLLVIHGERDMLIPPSEGRALYEQCAAQDKRLVTIPGAGHNDLLFRGRDIYFNAIREFVKEE